MSDQQSFASLAWSRKGKVTRRERFLAEMDAVIPWAELIALIGPHYPKGETGRPPQDLERMLRIYFLQQWFNLSDPQAEDAIDDLLNGLRFNAFDFLLFEPTEVMQLAAREGWRVREIFTDDGFASGYAVVMEKQK